MGDYLNDLFVDEVKGSIGRRVVAIEPMDDDIPKVFINGVITAGTNEMPAEIVYISKNDTFHAYLTIKAQGSSSLQYPKKNFTIKMYSDEAREVPFGKTFKDWGVTAHKYCLKANWIDHTHARNIVSANLWHQTILSRSDYNTLPEEMRRSPRNGAVDGFPIKLYANGVYQGIYTWNIPKDAWTWGMDESNENHTLLCAETNNNSANPCNFTALWDGVDGNDWSVEVGTNSYNVKTSLNNLIACVMDTDDETFKTVIDEYLDVQSAIDYIIHMTTLAAPDNVARNLLLATYDGVKWYCGAYDMDATFGSDASGSATVLATSSWPWNDPSRIGLWSRIKKSFKDELLQRYRELVTTVYAQSNMITMFERFSDLIGSELYDEDLSVYSSIPVAAGDVKYIRDFINARSWYADDVISPPIAPMTDGVYTDEYGYQMTISGRDVELIDSDEATVACFISLNATKNYLHSGDRVRCVMEAYPGYTLSSDVVLSCGKGNTSVSIKLGPGINSYTKFWDRTIVIDDEYTLWGVRLNGAHNTKFKVKIYINDVLYM